MALVRGIAGFALAVLFAIFAVANRQPVEIVWSPIHAPLPLPLYAVALGALALGFIFGGLAVLLRSVPKILRKGRKIRTLEKELGAAKAGKIPPQDPPQNWTALPAKTAELKTTETAS